MGDKGDQHPMDTREHPTGAQARARQGLWDTLRCWMGTSPHCGCGGRWGVPVVAQKERSPSLPVHTSL